MAVALVFLLFFTACGPATEGPGASGASEASSGGGGAVPEAKERITLKLWHIWATDSEASKKPFEKALSQWNRENPDCVIEAEATENETYKTKIRTAVAVNEAPDIFYDWGAGFAKPFVEAGKVLPLDEYLEDGTKEKLIQGSLDHFTYDGKIYALPIYMIAGVFYCNQELFDRCGIKIPETYDELLEAVKSFKQNGVTPMTVGEKDGWPGIFYQNILAIRTAGTKLCNQALNKEASFDRPEFTESARLLTELIKAGAFDNHCMDLTRDESEADFKNGKAAMYYNGSWVAGSLNREDCPVRGKIVVRNFPVVGNGGGDREGFLGGAIDTFMISSGTRYKEEAARALKTIDESFCRESYLSGAGIPAWKLDVEETQVNPLAADISRMLKNSPGYVLAWDTFLTAPETQIHINLVADLFAGRRTPEEFSAEMQKLNTAQ
jgi:raffinose/stachyose/melibiose transport system substrate-binding protein